MIKGHGGNVQALAKMHNCSIDEIIDMSSNINPLGPPEGLEEFIAANIHLIRSLPQPDAADITLAFSRYYNIPLNRVAAGNGTTWFIYTLPQALQSKKVVIVGPTYSDYRDGCIMNCVDFEFCMSDAQNMFQPDINKISDMAKNADTVIICNPNNPTGALIPKDSIIELLKAHPSTYFVIDESYLPFLINAEKISLISEPSFSNLIVISSMSKIFRIPGLRTGYLSAAPDVVEKLMKYYQPWSVNALSQAATAYILKNPEIIRPFLDMTRLFVQTEKKIFQDALGGCSNSINVCNGLKLYPGSTYFLLAEITGSMTSQQVCKMVGEHKILIRDCANFDGLSNHFVRFSLKDRETNLKLAEILTKLLSE
ncbi:MAG: aminotransferase class I/II-fold pyridoxal phosphate-dependent enzyme [Desulfamplus sp.]|nr:aminotransferase class I/II-fold pyridoxal phosphate-dependent enzyme [Desulfamplus sp.]